MGISPQITEDSWGMDSKHWLAARKGFDTCRSITLDLSLFTPALGFVNGFIPSGTVLGKITATDLYGPYDPDGDDGREIATGHLFDGVRLRDSGGNPFSVAGAAMLWEGIVLAHKLPEFTEGDDAGDEGVLDGAAVGALDKFIRYEGDDVPTPVYPWEGGGE